MYGRGREKGEKTWIKCGPRMSGRRIVVLWN